MLRNGHGIRGLLFDKDGTLLDFQGTWGGWAADLLLDVADGDAEMADAMAARVGLDRSRRVFLPDSFMISGTVEDAVDALAPFVPHRTAESLRRQIIETSMTLQPMPAVPLPPLMELLRDNGYVLGVATNDAEDAAEAQITNLGIRAAFEFVVGSDSGHGEKPDPGQCTAFAEATGLAPEKIAMIGDSTHDLHAGRAAGMVAIAVLTGPAGEDELAPHADVVLRDIGELPAWLGLDTATS